MPSMHKLSPEETLAERIRDTNLRLAAEFSDRFSTQDIQRLVSETVGAYKGAAVLDFVPLFVERDTRERLRSAVGAGNA